MAAAIGIDLGGTKVQAVRLDGDRVVAEARVATPHGAVDEVVTALAGLVAELGPADVVGIGVPGAVDAAAGVVRRAPNLVGFGGDVPLAALLAEATGTEVRLDNDVNVATLAELRLGAGRGSDELLAVFVGTGVGGGVVLGGRVRPGAAGEIGHVVVVDGGRACGCGGAGHLEAYAGRAAIEREARRRAAEGEPTALLELAGGGRMKSGVLAKALAAGDAMAASLLDEAVGALGAGIASAIALLDLELVVLGGGVTEKLGEGFVQRVAGATRERLFLADAPLRVVAAELGDHGGAIGAALL